MVDLELLRRILFDEGVSSFNKKRLMLAKNVLKKKVDINLVEKIFYCEDLGVDVDKGMLVDYINYYGIDNIYIGYRVNYFSNGDLMLRNMSGKMLIDDCSVSGCTSLFKHDNHDYYYYDLLDDNTRCEYIHPDIFYLRNGCAGMKKISQVLKNAEMKGKERIK